VAIGTLHFCVPPAQRKSGLRMIELDFDAQRFPALRGVTLLACDFEFVAVGAMKRSLECDVLTERNAPWEKSEEKEQKGPGT